MPPAKDFRCKSIVIRLLSYNNQLLTIGGRYSCGIRARFSITVSYRDADELGWISEANVCLGVHMYKCIIGIFQ